MLQGCSEGTWDLPHGACGLWRGDTSPPVSPQPGKELGRGERGGRGGRTPFHNTLECREHGGGMWRAIGCLHLPPRC